MRALEIEANLFATSEGSTVGLYASGKSGVISFSNIQRAGASAFRMFPLSARIRENLLRLHTVCAARDMSLTLEVCGRAVAVLGRQCRPGVFSRLLRVYPVEVRILPLAYALVSGAISGGGGEHRR